MRSIYLYAITLGFTVGVFVESYVAINFLIAVPCAGFAVLLFISAFLLEKKFRKYSICIGLLVVFFTCGIFSMSRANSEHGDSVLMSHAGEKIKVTGVITDEPDNRGMHTLLTVKIQTLSSELIASPTDILVNTFSHDNFAYGDAVTISGKLELPKNFLTTTGKEFDYISYLSKDGIYATMNASTISIDSSGNGSWLISKLYKLKEWFDARLRAVIPNPEGIFEGGLLLGEKSALPADMRADFVASGTIHMVALSGYNVTIVAEGIMRAARLVLARTAAIGFGIFSIILFALMTGGGATVVRASIMSVLALFARAAGRDFNVSRALAIVLFVMLIQNPKILVHDVSFQLSFLATLGLVYLTPIIEHAFRWIPKWGSIRAMASATMATTISTTPFILYSMGTMSFVSIPANLIIAPLIPLTMLTGFLAGIASAISNFLAWPFAWIAYALLKFELAAIHFFAHLPHAFVAVSETPLPAVIVLYVILIGVVIIWYPKYTKSINR